jgi:transposase
LLHADAFSGCEALYRPKSDGHVRITHVACWAHCRRKLFDVFEATKSPIAEEGLRRIQQLYAIEAGINGKNAELRLAQRQAQSVPLLDELQVWYSEQHSAAIDQKRPRQGVAICAVALGCADPLYNERPPQHR